MKRSLAGDEGDGTQTEIFLRGTVILDPGDASVVGINLSGSMMTRGEAEIDGQRVPFDGRGPMQLRLRRQPASQDSTDGGA